MKGSAGGLFGAVGFRNGAGRGDSCDLENTARCGPAPPSAPPDPGPCLGAILAPASRARQGDDYRLHLDFSARSSSFSAESTGKLGKVDAEPLQCGRRVFAYLRLAADQDAEQRAVAALDAGHPVVRITVSDVMQLGQETSAGRWQFAVAGINPFDHTQMQAAKVKTAILTEDL